MKPAHAGTSPVDDGATTTRTPRKQIGAVADLDVLTRDLSRYGAYFPTVRLIAPSR
jgi:hypothetical protein